MRRTIMLVPAFVAILSSPILADDPAKVFEQIYGPRIKVVLASPEKEDDHALVAELTRLGSDNTTEEAMATVMFTRGYDLAMRDPSGAGLAAEAMAALAARFESQREFAMKKRIDALNVLMLRGKPEERDEATAQMIDLLVAQGDEQAANSKYNEASATYRRAMLLSGRVKSRSPDAIKLRMGNVLQQVRAAKQVEIYRAKLLGDRSDHATAEALVKLYLTELDKPADAVPYLDIVKDEMLKRVATLATRATGELTEDEALVLAEWYYAASRSAKGLAEAVTLARAKASLDRYLALHETTSLARTKALAMLGEVERGLAEAVPVIARQDPATSASTTTPSLPKDAILVYSFEKDTLGGTPGSPAVKDLSGKGNDGAGSGVTPDRGIAGDGLKFDGKDDFIQIDALQKLITGGLRELSIVVWVRAERVELAFIFDVGVYAERSVSLTIGSELRFSLADATGTDKVTAKWAFDNQWHHLAFTWDGKERVIYFDGKPVAKGRTESIALTGELLSYQGSSPPPRIGSQAKLGLRNGRYFAGTMDELAMFARCLSEKEVNVIFQAGKTGTSLGQFRPAE